MRRLDPAYRAVYADGTELHVRADMADLREEIAAHSGSATPRRSTDFVDWLEQLYEVGDRHFIDHNFDSPLDLLRSPAGRARCCGSAASARSGQGRVVLRRRPAACACSASRRCTPGWRRPARSRGLRGHHLHGHASSGVYFPEGGMHAVPAALATAFADAGGRLRYGVEVTEVLRRARRRRRRGRDRRRRAASRADAVVCTARPAGRLRPPAAGRSGPPGGPAGRLLAVGRRLAPRCPRHPRPAGRPPQHPLRPRVGHRLRRADRPRRADARPVPPGHRADGHRPDAAPRRAARPSTSWSRCRTPGPALDWRRESGPMRDRLLAFLDAERLPHRHRRGAPRHPRRLGGAGHGPRHPVRPRPHLRPDRAVPARERRAARPGLVLRRLGHDARASASRWC